MSKKNLISSVLIAAAIGILIAIYYSPIWWVALTAPNYPEEAFPDAPEGRSATSPPSSTFSFASRRRAGIVGRAWGVC